MASALDRLAAAPPLPVEELRQVPVFSDLPEDGLAWLAAQMHVADLAPGDVGVEAGAPAEYMFVILKGEIRAERSDGVVYMAISGEVTGLLPFSRLATYSNAVRAVVPTRMAGLHKDFFPEMARRMPVLQERLVNLLSDRIRSTTAAFKQREKLAALGKLSAGLAHEMNNPASAAQRASANLRSALLSVRRAALKLDKNGLPQSARVFLAQLECDWEQNDGTPRPVLDSLDRSEREEEIAAWLQRRAIQQPWDLATGLVDLGCTVETLQRVSDNVPAEFLSDVLIRLTAAFTITSLASEIESSTARISELVKAVKEYSYMDQMPEQDLDIHGGLESTLVMLNHKLKKGVDVIRDYDRSLPKVRARGSELNQIWTNLIVNAIEAMAGQGKLTVRTLRDGRCARVEVIDNGPGIPEEAKPHIFEPFFTTKSVGEGTGLGLDTVYRIARINKGDVNFDSSPGETRFVVRIPFSGSDGDMPSRDANASEAQTERDAAPVVN